MQHKITPATRLKKLWNGREQKFRVNLMYPLPLFHDYLADHSPTQALLVLLPCVNNEGDLKSPQSKN